MGGTNYRCAVQYGATGGRLPPLVQRARQRVELSTALILGLAETGLDERSAVRLLEQGSGDLRVALVMFITGKDASAAADALERANYVVADAVVLLEK